MRKFLAAGLAAASLLGTGMVGLGTAWAQEDPDWVMPSFQGMTLQAAKDQWAATTGGEGPELGTRIMNTNQLQPMNPLTWEVCGQKPGPGASISASSSPAVAVAPPNRC